MHYRIISLSLFCLLQMSLWFALYALWTWPMSLTFALRAFLTFAYFVNVAVARVLCVLDLAIVAVVRITRMFHFCMFCKCCCGSHYVHFGRGRCCCNCDYDHVYGSKMNLTKTLCFMMCCMTQRLHFLRNTTFIKHASYVFATRPC